MNILPQKGKRNKPRPADGVYSFSDGQRPCYNLHSSQVGRLRPTLLLPTSARKGQAGGLQTIYRSDVPYNQCQDKKSHCPSIKIFFRHLFRPACVCAAVADLSHGGSRCVYISEQKRQRSEEQRQKRGRRRHEKENDTAARCLGGQGRPPLRFVQHAPCVIVCHGRG